MLIKDVRECRPFLAIDGTVIREMLHPVETGMTIACSLAHASLGPGESSKPHRLKTSSEIYYILGGKGTMHVGHQSADVCTGQIVFIPPGMVQYIENTGRENLVFLCVVDPAWHEEDEEVV
ncbi:MAG TPA: cupin domain-containing protein [Deltaproteobacteria bacterium]|nr:cupin domain-containing protein [Deltaproteobacteria bacterium]